MTLVLSSSVLLPIADALRGKVKVHKRLNHEGEYMAMTAASPFIDELGASTPETLSTNDWRGAVGF